MSAATPAGGMADRFDELDRAAGLGIDRLLEALEARLRAEGRYHDLFETLKMKARGRAGLSPARTDVPDDLSESRRQTLEEGLLAACRETGLLFLRQAALRDAWTYLRPIRDVPPVRDALARVEPDASNAELLVEILLREGVDIERGFRIVLEHFGTCSAITTLETVLADRSLADRRLVIGLLVDQLHRELVASLRADIGRREGAEPAESTVGELVANRSWLFEDCAYHVDLSHLISTLRFARVLEDPDAIRRALDLTSYGLRTPNPPVLEQDEPFADVYVAHRHFLGALVGDAVESGVAYFREKSRRLRSHRLGAAARQSLVDLLARLGRDAEALGEALEFLSDAPAPRLPFPLLELAEDSAAHEAIRRFCRERGDLLGYAASWVDESEERSTSDPR
ncbi:MAG: hypothetical protein FJ297_11635 [Planctomycetes bacterium]|nr:hypothetical protein [Planctomycetota bacterium]